MPDLLDEEEFEALDVPDEDTEQEIEVVPLELRGGNLAAYEATDPEILLVGGAGSGKTYTVLSKMHHLALADPRFRGLILRKTAVSLGSSTLPTFQEQVMRDWDRGRKRSDMDGVSFFGGSVNEAQAYMYDNGARIVVGGMDQQTKVLGSFYDIIFLNQAEEFALDDLLVLKSRLRNTSGVRHKRIICDCNPTYDRHWLLRRAQSGYMRHLESSLKDNPQYFDADGNPTEAGAGYVAQLEGLTGTMRQRLLLGQWVGMENSIYAESLNADTMFISLPDHISWTGRAVGGMDYGRVHLSAVVALTQSSDGSLWVRECWTGGGDRDEIMQAARRHRAKYGVFRGVTDPIQEWAAQDLGWKPAKSGAGSRKGRIQKVIGLLNDDILRFDKYGEGVQELWDEMMMYRYEIKETDTSIEDVVVRKDDDRVAALEYAVEAWLGPELKPLDIDVPPLEKKTIGGFI